LAEEKPKPRPRRKRAAAGSPAPARAPRKPAAAIAKAPRRPRRAPAPKIAVAVQPVAVDTSAAAPRVADARELPAARAGGLYEALWRTGLLNVGALVRKEFTAYFVSPVGYVIAALMVLIVSLLGFLPPISQGRPVAMSAVYDWVVYLLAFTAPLLSMRLLAEERSNGTLELLLTSPVRDWELVLGKWLGALVFFVAITAFLLVHVAILVHYQATNQVIDVLGLSVSIGNLDLGPTLTGYLGVMLVAAALLAVGLLCSSLSQNQVLAAFLAVAASVFLVLVLIEAVYLPAPLVDIAQYVGVYEHFVPFNQGRVLLRDLVYFATLTAGALFLTTRILESRRWR
jgi:ABC-2 type transport system permease protein